MRNGVFSKGNIGSCEIKNRFVVPPMDTSHTDETHEVNDEIIAYYAARARGGFGLIITEYTSVDCPDGLSNPTQLAIFDDRFIPGMARLAQAVHREGAKIFVQLQHPGRETNSSITGRRAVAPSAIPSLVPGSETPRALETGEVYELINKFASGALRAKKAGMDGVEVQCGHGYIIGQFLSGLSNKRTDEFGGDLEGRMKLATSVVSEIKRLCGADFPVSCRISGEERVSGGLTIRLSAVIAKALERAGADAIHVSTGISVSGEYMIAPAALPQGVNLYAAQAIKNAVDIPVIAVGRITEPMMANGVIEDGVADFVALGRASIADPEFPNKFAQNRCKEITPCVGCLSRCFYTEGVIPGDRGLSCMLNPFTGHETTLNIAPAKNCKNVVVVGGGPGGLEAAWVSAACGHKVALFEKNERCGGQFLAAAVPPGKQEMARAVAWLIKMCEKYGVDIHTSREISADEIIDMEPDAVILATGATPIDCPVDCSAIASAQAVDILLSKENPGRNNVIIGGGMVGLETAEYIASQGYAATVIEMKDAVGADIDQRGRKLLLKSLKELGVRIMTGEKLARVTPCGVVCEGTDGASDIAGFDKLVTAIGSRAYNPLYEGIKGKIADVYVIGDALRARRGYCAIEEAARAALKL